MKISDFDYALPDTSIAQFPPEVRGQSRLLVLDRSSGAIEHHKYSDLVNHFSSGDVLVLNDTKVIKARLIATTPSGHTRELLLLEQHGHEVSRHRRKCIYRGKLSPGDTLIVDAAKIKVTQVYDGGITEIESDHDILSLAEHEGTVPLPPYMKRQATQDDINRYQTVFAQKPGSVAAPTASLNFTSELAKQLTAKGVQIVYLTLHVGLGTFLPIRTDEVEEHQMHSEYFEISKATLDTLQRAKHESRKITALGTTVARTLEYAADDILSPSTSDITGEADIFIYPGYQFRVVDQLLTNFHAPRSTVLMLAATFAGWDNLKHAYQAALNEGYQFLSYGDSMLIK